MSEGPPAWIEAARRHPSVEVVADAWGLVVRAVTLGRVEADGLIGVEMQLRAGGDVVLEGLGVWPSGESVIVEVDDGTATVDRAAFLDVLDAAAKVL